MLPIFMSDRQKELLRACVESELENNARCDTQLSLTVTEDADDPDAAGEELRKELQALLEVLK